MASSTKKDSSPSAAQSAVRLYWGVFGVVVFTLIFLGAMGNSQGVVYLIFLLLGLPLVQLAASVLAAILILVLPLEGKGTVLSKVGSLTWKAFLGALLGLLGMGGLLLFFTLF